jgi:hypothetical protein
MSPRRSFEHQLTDWLDEGPVSAPRDDLATVLNHIPAIRQRHAVGPWRITMPTLARVAAAVIAVVIGTIAIVRLTLPTGLSVGTQPSPTPGWAQRFPKLTASQFDEPFTYALDPSLGIEATEQAESYLFRAPGQNPVAVVDHVGQIRQNPCLASAGGIDVSPTAQEFVTIVSGVKGLSATRLPASTIDGRPALGVDLKRATGTDCHDVWLFDSEESFTCCWPDDPTWVRRIWAIDVDGKLITVTTPFGAADKDARLAIAGAFVQTIHFLAAPDASPSR